MTDTRTWPTREEWEANERARAEWTIEHGEDRWDYEGKDDLWWSDDERAEVKRLAPIVIAMIRRTASRVERAIRCEHPQAGVLARGITGRPITLEALHRHQAAVDALDDANRSALDALWALEDIRRDLHTSRGTARCAANPDRFECPTERDVCGWTFERRWPDGYDQPQSAELDRLRELNHRAVERSRAKYREMGRRILADLDSGVRWQRELERRAQVDEYFRNGLVIHVIRPTTPRKDASS